jgi:1-acyl-sn-glycerol-3-phosphate acyltransferase
MPDWLSFWWYEYWYCVNWAAFTLGFSFRCAGSHNVPPNGAALIVANHQSFLDPTLVGVAARRHLTFLARKTLFKNPIFGAFLRSVNCVPVDQEGVAKEGLKTAVEKLHAGRAVLIFPEGERTWKGPMQKLKPGIQLLIKRAPAPIVPVGIAGAYEAYPRTAKYPVLSPLFLPANKKGPLAISIGRPLDPKRLLELPREELLTELFNAIRAEQIKAEQLRRKP